MRRHPHLFEINTLSFLNRLSDRSGTPVRLSTVPDGEWRAIKQRGFDYVWLMGVWERSRASRVEALKDSRLCEAYQNAVPGWREDDIS
jgi:hypothetical protein